MAALLRAFAFIVRVATGKLRAQSASIEGRGAVYHKDGRVTEFRMTGEPTAQILAFAHRKVFGRLASIYPRQLGAVTHGAAIRTTVCDAVVDALDASGNLVFRTSGDVEVATLPFSATAFGAASGPTATANTITSDTNATGGTVAKFTAETSGATTIFTGAVSTSGSDINLSSLSVGASDTVSVSSLTYTAMP
jgi:hypothetical protein